MTFITLAIDKKTEYEKYAQNNLNIQNMQKKIGFHKFAGILILSVFLLYY